MITLFWIKEMSWCSLIINGRVSKVKYHNAQSFSLLGHCVTSSLLDDNAGQW